MLSPALKLIALDPLSGNAFWTFDPFDGNAAGGNSRGITYWSDEKIERIFYAAGSYLFAIDANDGTLHTYFGQEGKINLQYGLGDAAIGKYVSATTPGIIHKDLFIIGSRVGEGPAPSAPGHIRAYDVRTGEMKWIFHTIPKAGTYGAEYMDSQYFRPDGWC